MPGISNDEIDERFGYHPPSRPEIRDAHEAVREFLGNAAKALCGLVPAGREQSLMVTHLEEAMYWANAAIARQQRVGG